MPTVNNRGHFFASKRGGWLRRHRALSLLGRVIDHVKCVGPSA
jgi:hypothetical protein